MRTKEEHRANTMVTESAPAALWPDGPSPTNLLQTGSTLNSMARNPAKVPAPARPGGLQMKPQAHNGSMIDARRLVGVVLLFAGTTLICIGGGIGFVACRSVTSSSSLLSAPSKKSSKTPAQSLIVERETFIAPTCDHRASSSQPWLPAAQPITEVNATEPAGLDSADPLPRYKLEPVENVLSNQQLTTVVTEP